MKNSQSHKVGKYSFALFNGIYSGLRLILLPSFIEICSEVFCGILLTNQPNDQPAWQRQ